MLRAGPTSRISIPSRELAVAAGVYAALAIVASWPLVLHLHDRVPGSDLWGSRPIYAESLLNLWDLWWFRHALVDLGQDPFACRYVLYPYGANLWFHTLAPLHGVIGIALQTFASLAAAQNLMLLLDLIAAGVCTAALGRRLGLEPPAALVAGGVYAFSPVVFAHLYAGHYELIATYWLPALLLAFLRILDAPAPRARDGLVLGLLFVGAAYSSQYYWVYGIELLAVAALFRLPALRRPALASPLAVAALVMGVGLAPLLWNFLGAAGPRPDPGGASDFDRFAGDLIGFLVPSFTHPLLAEPLRGLHERLVGRSLPQEVTTNIGLCVLGLAALGWLRRRRLHPPLGMLLAIALVFALLSLGSHLQFLGRETGLPLPNLLLQQIPVVRLARAPGRQMVVAMLGFSVLAGAGWQQLERRWLRACALGVLAFEYAAFPLPLMSTEVAPVYRRLAGMPGDFAVLDLPLGVRDGRGALGWPDNKPIYAQTVHGHPIVSAAVSRLPPETWQAVLATPVIGTLLDPARATPEARRRDRMEGPAFFARFAIEAVVVQPTALGSSLQKIVEADLPIRSRERFDDGTQLLWVGQP